MGPEKTLDLCAAKLYKFYHLCVEVEKAAMMTAPMGFDNQDSVKDTGMAKDFFS